MIFYSPSITRRLQYIANVLGNLMLDEPLQFLTDLEKYKLATGPKINYSNTKIGHDEFWLKPDSLLFEKDVREQHFEIFDIGPKAYFFKTEGDFPFDIFAAAFYLLSRYEEYLPHEKDMYGRYAHENSLAFKNNFLDIPLVNSWLESFKEQLKNKFSSITLRQSSFTYLPTYDIDEAYSFKHKAWLRSTGAGVRDLMQGKWKRFNMRLKVFRNEQQDPFDSYDWMDNLHQSLQLKPRYFFLVAEKRGKYDKNILPKETALQELIKKHADKYTIGIHPSWQSGDDASLLKKEFNTLEQIAANKITSSRQHFIRFALPTTFRQLIDAGIKEDFSMGYGSINGFRASISSPYYWYDLAKEETTELLLYPFCYMDANCFFEQKQSPSQALEEMKYYYQQVKKVNGTFVSIWHNTFLGTDKLFAGWRQVYEQFIKQVT